MKDARRGERGCTLHELLFFILLVGCVMAGFGFGWEIGTRYGSWGRVIGCIIGLVSGIAVVIAIGFILTLIGKVKRWWRPWYPVCANGVCRTGDYQFEKIPEDVPIPPRGISRYASRCKCGHLYSTVDWGFNTYRVCVLPDGSILPYMMYKPFGRWQPDEGAWIQEWLEKSREPERPKEHKQPALNIPDWIVPWAMAIFFAGILCLTALFHDKGFSSPVFPDLLIIIIIVCLLSGYGYVIHKKLETRRKKWAETHPEEQAAKEKYKASREKIYEFFFLKGLSILPGILFIINLNRANADSKPDAFGLVFFGSWFLAFFFTNGLSFRQYKNNLNGRLNGYSKIIALFSYLVLFLCIIGMGGIALAHMILYGRPMGMEGH